LGGIIAVQPPQLKTTMPFYEYECQNCKFYTELMQKISDPPLEKCPSCGKKTMKKLISAPVFRLKGAGWYETDFKSDNENKRNLAGADKEESKSDESSSTKSDAKSDAKGDVKPAAVETKTAAPVEAKSAGSSGSRSSSSAGRSAIAAKGGHKKAAGKPVARTASKAKPKAKAKGKAGKGRR
jgi:putative FmdB family regulatory protein